MAQAKNDKDGWKRGAGAYSRDYVKFDRPEDRKSIKGVEKDGPEIQRTGPVSRGGPPRYKPKHGPQTNGAN